MNRFTKAIVRPPSSSMVNGITTAELGQPNYELALIQHQDYVQALRECGLEVIELPPLKDFPDSTFVEDVALCTPECAIVTRPGASTRRGEAAEIVSALEDHYDSLIPVKSPGTVEAGDIMMVGNYYYIGLSDRTNRAGAQQVIDCLVEHGMNGTMVEMSEFLHLKTGLSYLEHQNLLVCGEFVSKSEFQLFNKLPVDEDEAYAANSVWVNETVLVPKGFSKTQKTIQDLGYKVREVDVSEFQKLDGGLSCLSLRF